MREFRGQQAHRLVQISHIVAIRPHLFDSGEPQNYALFGDEMISRLMKWQRECRTLALPGEAPR